MTDTTQETGTGNAKLDEQCRRIQFTRALSCPMSVDERLQRGERAAMLRGHILQMEEEKDAQNKLAKAKIEEVEAEARRLELEQRSKTVTRDVPCETRIIFKTRAVQEWRLDTNEMISERAMTAEEVKKELQGHLDFEASKGKSGAAKPNGAAADGRGGAEKADGAKDDGIVDDEYVAKAKAEAEGGAGDDSEAGEGGNDEPPPPLETAKPGKDEAKPKGRGGGKGRKGKR